MKIRCCPWITVFALTLAFSCGISVADKAISNNLRSQRKLGATPDAHVATAAIVTDQDTEIVADGIDECKNNCRGHSRSKCKQGCYEKAESCMKKCMCLASGKSLLLV